MKKVHISIVCSVYNEQESLSEHYKLLTKTLTSLSNEYEILYINDGSSDNSNSILEEIASKDLLVKVISFSKNFGHEAAMTAGIDNAMGDLIVCMDSDLQHPPELIKKMIELNNEGYEIVNTVRSHTENINFVRKKFTALFYSLINKISKFEIEPNASDYFMISARVAKILKSEYREFNKFTRVIIQNIGFKKTKISFVASKRFAGVSKYSYRKLMLLSITAIIATSNMPLRLGIFLGFIFGIFSFIVGVYSIIMKIYGFPFSGYTTLIVFLSLAFSIQFIIIGIIGEYIGNLFMEAKKRPSYIVKDKINFNES